MTGDVPQRQIYMTALPVHTMMMVSWIHNVFQVNVEEARHLWAMVYLLHKYFGRDGREEAQELLSRRSGDENRPRLLGAFNEETPDWLSFFMFTYFTDRDGKMQLESLAQSGFDPLSRTCRFMLTEEAHHMFVGETGVGRVIQATLDAMSKAGITDPNDIGNVRDLGVIDLPTIQKKLNLHYTLSLDLFGQEVSTMADAKCSPRTKQVKKEKNRNKTFSSKENNPQNISVYTGTFDTNDKVGDDKTTLMGIEHKNKDLFRDTWIGKFSPTTGAFVTKKSSIYIYTGIETDYDLGPINISPSFAPGYYQAGDGKNLGRALEFKSEIKVGVDLFKNTNLGYSYSHISNNDWGDVNPGTDNQTINFSKKF